MRVPVLTDHWRYTLSSCPCNTTSGHDTYRRHILRLGEVLDCQTCCEEQGVLDVPRQTGPGAWNYIGEIFIFLSGAYQWRLSDLQPKQR